MSLPAKTALLALVCALLPGLAVLGLGPAALLAATEDAEPAAEEALELPWAEVGLTERQAVVHALNLFSFGPRPGEVERVLELGLEKWLAGQLAGALPEDELETRLAETPSLAWSHTEIVERAPPGRFVRAEAARILEAEQEAPAEGLTPEEMTTEETTAGELNPAQLTKGEFPAEDTTESPTENLSAGDASSDRMPADLEMADGPSENATWDDPTEMRERTAEVAAELAEERDYRSWFELQKEVRHQRLLRARYAENQLREVLTEFWMNRFSVSLVDAELTPHLLSFERDAVRPRVLGRFRDLLGAAARHPALLLYLDNATSQAAPAAETTFDLRFDRIEWQPQQRRQRRAWINRLDWKPRALRIAQVRAGLNENFARELLELYTVGTGVYRQRDVSEVARAFTGWTVMPSEAGRDRIAEQVAQKEMASRLGFVRQAEFLFRADWHDAEPKEILGLRLEGDLGMDGGERVLDLLARHPSTARRLSNELVLHFVSDSPSSSLVDRLQDAFAASNGDLRVVLRSLIESRELWAAAFEPPKTKSPLEYVVSSLRATDAEVKKGRALAGWLGRMGQPLYGAPDPAGFSERSQDWSEAGSLLQRLSFAFALASNRVGGVSLDARELFDEPAPKTLAAAVRDLSTRLLPERGSPELMAAVLEGAEDRPSASGRERARHALALVLASPQFQQR